MKLVKSYHQIQEIHVIQIHWMERRKCTVVLIWLALIALFDQFRSPIDDFDKDENFNPSKGRVTNKRKASATSKERKELDPKKSKRLVKSSWPLKTHLDIFYRYYYDISSGFFSSSSCIRDRICCIYFWHSWDHIVWNDFPLGNAWNKVSNGFIFKSIEIDHITITAHTFSMFSLVPLTISLFSLEKWHIERSTSQKFWIQQGWQRQKYGKNWMKGQSFQVQI